MSLVHFIEDPTVLIENMQKGMPFAKAICGKLTRKRSLAVQPFVVSCPSCAMILNEAAQSAQDAQQNAAPAELPPELPDELPEEEESEGTGLELSGFLGPLLDLESPGRCIEDSEFIFDWGKTNSFMEESDKAFIEGISDFAKMLGREGLANQLWSVLFRSVGRGLDIGQCIGLLSGNVKTISNQVDAGLCDSALQNMLTEETQGKNRKSVVDSIDRRMESIKGLGEE